MAGVVLFISLFRASIFRLSTHGDSVESDNDSNNQLQCVREAGPDRCRDQVEQDLQRYRSRNYHPAEEPVPA